MPFTATLTAIHNLNLDGLNAPDNLAARSDLPALDGLGLSDLTIDLTVTFDLSGYPHILDLIFAHCTKSTLLDARTACRAWRDRIDHLTLTNASVISGPHRVPPNNRYTPMVETSLGVELDVSALHDHKWGIRTLNLCRSVPFRHIDLPNLEVLFVDEYSEVISAPRVVQVADFFATLEDTTHNSILFLNPTLEGEVTWVLQYADPDDLVFARLIEYPLPEDVTAVTLVGMRVPHQAFRPQGWTCDSCAWTYHWWLENGAFPPAHYHTIDVLQPRHDSPSLLESVAELVRKNPQVKFKFVGGWHASWVIQANGASFETKFRWAVCNDIPRVAYSGDDFLADLTASEDILNLEFVESDEGVDDVLARLVAYE